MLPMFGMVQKYKSILIGQYNRPVLGYSDGDLLKNLSITGLMDQSMEYPLVPLKDINMESLMFYLV